jgi:ribonucleoside-diphosphate reductase alpha chain
MSKWPEQVQHLIDNTPEIKYSDNAKKIYDALYLAKNNGELNIFETNLRVAEGISNDQQEFEMFFHLIHNKVFRPNTPCMIHAGITEKHAHNNQLCACFVIDLQDSMESIIELWKICSLIYASGAGAGFRITALREKGSPLSTGGFASGPLAYLKVCDTVSETVRSGGRHRRAANLGAIDYWHPDILEMLEAKETGNLSSFNLSILMDDAFMGCASKLTGSPAVDEFLIELRSPNPLIEIKETIDGSKLWKKLIHNAWSKGDPGLIFIDTVNKFNPVPSKGKIVSTNPCGEVPLLPDTACVIGSINLVQCLEEEVDPTFTEHGHGLFFNWEKFREAIKWGTIALDNILDKTSYIHERFEKNMRELRPIGLGIMGFADMLVYLGIEYGSKECCVRMHEICKTLTLEAIRTSLEICKKKGKLPCVIPVEDQKHFEKLLKNYGCNSDDIKSYRTYGIRNSSWTCIAPTGSISISADCSYSFEPLTAIVWEKELAEYHEIMKFVNPQFEKWLNSNYSNKPYMVNNKQKLLNEIIENNGSVQSLSWIPDYIKKKFKVAHDINPHDKLKVQAAGQRWISMAISSTCNLPNEATEQDVEDIYIAAWKLGLKGITVYRDGCKEWQPMNFGKKDIPDANNPKNALHWGGWKDIPSEEKGIEENLIGEFHIEEGKGIVPNFEPPTGTAEAAAYNMEYINHRVLNGHVKRPPRRPGETFEFDTPHGRMYLTLNTTQDGKPLEVFVRMGKQGSYINLLWDVISRSISSDIQKDNSPENIKKIARRLINTEEQKFWIKNYFEPPMGVDSIAAAVGHLMELYFITEKPIGETIEKLEPINAITDAIDKISKVVYKRKSMELCPKCNNWTLEMGTGCRNGGTCVECGYTSCS